METGALTDQGRKEMYLRQAQQSIRVAAIALTLIVMAGGLTATAQKMRHLSRGSTPGILDPEVSFLETPPVIDGTLDSALASLPVRSFPIVDHYSSDSVVAASYRLAYGTDFFYVEIEAAADKLTFRDRAYQNGDGFHMVIGAPRPDNAPTDEFYVLACSAVNRESAEWSRRIFWYYNVDRIFIPTSDKTQLAFHEGNGKISFELLLPWADVHPYQPWLSAGIGFNLAFVKAIEPDRIMKFQVVEDPRIDSENNKRFYTVLKFAKPELSAASQIFVEPERGHIFEGDSLKMVTAAIAADTGQSEIGVTVRSGEGDRVVSSRFPIHYVTGVSHDTMVLNTSQLSRGGYQIEWNSRNDNLNGKRGLTVIPELALDKLRTRIDAARGKVSTSTLCSIEFSLAELQKQLQSLRFYETCSRQRSAAERLLESVSAMERGEDRLAAMTGFVRKAYRSGVDSTLQPYVVWIPEDFRPEKKYPLVVYLHGSASDERSIMHAEFVIPKDFIGLGPNGRGPSNGYCADHAQDDIAEAIAAVCRDYPIDTTKIVLTGFSMGGYGVYRTYFETPSKFRALAVFSGAPDIGPRYTGDKSQPDFLKTRYLRAFKGIPIFVFHGEQDRNCPFAQTKELMAILKQAGAMVELVTEPNKGHDSPDKSTIEKYLRWIDKVIPGRLTDSSGTR
jgi:predicted esterase